MIDVKRVCKGCMGFTYNGKCYRGALLAGKPKSVGTMSIRAYLKAKKMTHCPYWKASK